MAAARLFWIFLMLLPSFDRAIQGYANTETQVDLYELLGVHRKASIKEIKQAYRRKALDTHPDKNVGVPPEEATDAFRNVVRAFEILSDESARQRYDRTGRTDNESSSYGGRQQYTQHFHFQWSGRARMLKMKDRFDVQQAQSRVLHVVSLAQLQTIMLNDDDLLDRNLLLCFTTPLTDEQADDEMVFPYPFAAMSSQGIWWEDLLQTVRIRFYRNSELSKFFGVSADDANQRPVFIFAKRDTSLTEEFAPLLPRIHTGNRQSFESWVWEQIQVEVRFVNKHTFPVEIYWVHGTTANLKETLEPNDESWHTTMLSHEWYIRDARVDTYKGANSRYKLTKDSSLGSFKILSDESPQEIIIQANQCFDLSGHCSFWLMHEDACRTNPGFMNEHCQKTCGVCSVTNDDGDEDHDDQEEDQDEFADDEGRDEL
jgi:curved DNA-binding protein CbpA